MLKRRIMVGTALLVPALAAACDQPVLSGEAAAARPEPAPARQEAPGLDGEFVRLARQLPGFGGYWFDESGDLNVVLVDAGQERAARALLGGVAEGRLERPGRPFQRPAAIRVREGRYDFARLDAWRARMRTLLRDPGVVFLDADEVANRVLVAVEDDAAAARVEGALPGLGVPREAVIVRRSAPIRATATVRDQIRPTIGGLEITRQVTEFCTLGVNAYYNNAAMGIFGAAGFFTAAHCTSSVGTAGGSQFGQPLAYVGTELVDPAPFTSASDPACPVGVMCRYSDVAFVQYDGSVSWSLGTLARVAWEGHTSAGSLTLDASFPTRQITAVGQYPVYGQTLHKVGRTTGGTYGTVQNTCIDGPTAGSVRVLCQFTVNAAVGYGDSGSPVWGASPGHDTVFYGILWALSSPEIFVFSPVGQIAKDFGIAITYH